MRFIGICLATIKDFLIGLKRDLYVVYWGCVSIIGFPDQIWGYEIMGTCANLSRHQVRCRHIILNNMLKHHNDCAWVPSFLAYQPGIKHCNWKSPIHEG